MSATARPQWRLTGEGAWLGWAERLSTFIRKGTHRNQGAGKPQEPNPQPTRKAKGKRRQMLCASVDNISTCGQEQKNQARKYRGYAKDQRLSAFSQLFQLSLKLDQELLNPRRGEKEIESTSISYFAGRPSTSNRFASKDKNWKRELEKS